MSDNQYNNNRNEFQGRHNNVLYDRFGSNNKRPAVVELLIKLGVVRDERQANYMLYAFIVFSVVVALYFFFFHRGGELAPGFTEFSKDATQQHAEDYKRDFPF